jgi:molybdopterin synthase sulfur carrier subunit
MIRVLFFASVRDRLDVAELEVADVPADVAALRQQLAAKGDAWAVVFGADRPVLAAVNQAMASADTPLSDGDEVGFFPPVTGG